MRRIKIATFDALMVELRAELDRGHIYHARISSDGDMIEGLYEPSSGAVYVDPVPNVVDTLIHELLHRRYPRWGERRVSETAHKLTTAMTDHERRAFYRHYQRIAKRMRKPVYVEA